MKYNICKIYYGNGYGEEITIDSKEARELGVDSEQLNLGKIVNKLIKNGWKIETTLVASANQS